MHVSINEPRQDDPIAHILDRHESGSLRISVTSTIVSPAITTTAARIPAGVTTRRLHKRPRVLALLGLGSAWPLFEHPTPLPPRRGIMIGRGDSQLSQADVRYAIVPAILTQHSYGKSRIRCTKVTRLADRHEVRELTIEIQLEGDFAGSYTGGDNSLIIPRTR